MTVKTSPSMESRLPEDDTFDALRMPSFERISALMVEELGNNASHDAKVAFLKKHNWTMSRWIKKRMGSRD